MPLPYKPRESSDAVAIRSTCPYTPGGNQGLRSLNICITLGGWNYISWVFKEEGPSFLRKEKPVQSWLLFPQQWQQPRAQCSTLSQKMCPTRWWVSPHQTSYSAFQIKSFGCRWSRQCITMVWRQKKWQAREMWQISFPESLKTCRKSDLTNQAET